MALCLRALSKQAGRSIVFRTSTSTHQYARTVTRSAETPNKDPPAEWRKKQLQDLEDRWDAKPMDVQSDDELQPMWQDMERRVKFRRPRTLDEAGGKTGRQNIKRTDEDVWLQEGLYASSSNRGEAKTRKK